MRDTCSWFPQSALLLLLVASALDAEASVYRYVDDRGVVHFTNVPEDPRYQWYSSTTEGHAERQRKRRDTKAPVENAYDEVIVWAARSHRIEPALVKAVIAAESNFRPTAVSRVGAQGLMQLMPNTAKVLGVRNPFHPVENVEAGTRYLREMLDRYGDLRRALAAYNAGPDAVDHYQGIPPYQETQAYITRVLNYYHGYHGEFRRRFPPRTGRPPGSPR